MGSGRKTNKRHKKMSVNPFARSVDDCWVECRRVRLANAAPSVMTVMDQRLQLLDTDTWSARVRSRSNVCGPGRKSMDWERGCKTPITLPLIAEKPKRVGGEEATKEEGPGTGSPAIGSNVQ